MKISYLLSILKPDHQGLCGLKTYSLTELNLAKLIGISLNHLEPKQTRINSLNSNAVVVVDCSVKNSKYLFGFKKTWTRDKFLSSAHWDEHESRQLWEKQSNGDDLVLDVLQGLTLDNVTTHGFIQFLVIFLNIAKKGSVSILKGSVSSVKYFHNRIHDCYYDN